MIKPIYDKHEWILGECIACGRCNYVEPHGTTAHCDCSNTWTEHQSIPYALRIGMYLQAVRLTRAWKLIR